MLLMSTELNKLSYINQLKDSHVGTEAGRFPRGLQWRVLGGQSSLKRSPAKEHGFSMG